LRRSAVIIAKSIHHYASETWRYEKIRPTTQVRDKIKAVGRKPSGSQLAEVQKKISSPLPWTPLTGRLAPFRFDHR